MDGNTAVSILLLVFVVIIIALLVARIYESLKQSSAREGVQWQKVKTKKLRAIFSRYPYITKLVRELWVETWKEKNYIKKISTEKGKMIIWVFHYGKMDADSPDRVDIEVQGVKGVTTGERQALEIFSSEELWAINRWLMDKHYKIFKDPREKAS